MFEIAGGIILAVIALTFWRGLLKVAAWTIFFAVCLLIHATREGWLFSTI